MTAEETKRKKEDKEKIEKFIVKKKKKIPSSLFKMK